DVEELGDRGGLRVRRIGQLTTRVRQQSGTVVLLGPAQTGAQVGHEATCPAVASPGHEREQQDAGGDDERDHDPRDDGSHTASISGSRPGSRGQTGPRGIRHTISTVRRRDSGQAPASSRLRWPITVVPPSPRMVTPYSASATSMVRFWWVITISWLSARSSVKISSRRPRLTSSSAAST